MKMNPCIPLISHIYSIIDKNTFNLISDFSFAFNIIFAKQCLQTAALVTFRQYITYYNTC